MTTEYYTTLYSKNLGIKLSVLNLKLEGIKTEDNLVIYRDGNMRLVLQKTLHRDLAKRVAERVRSLVEAGSKYVEVDPIYEEVEQANEKKYLLKRGCSVYIGDKIYTKAIYKSGEGHFYKDMETKEWIEVEQLEKDIFAKK